MTTLLEDRGLFPASPLLNAPAGHTDVWGTDEYLGPTDGVAAGLLEMVGNQVRARASLGHRRFVALSLRTRSLENVSGRTVEVARSQNQVLLRPLWERSRLAPVFEVQPVIRGRLEVGMMLRCLGARSWAVPGAMHRYQWLRNGVEISGATRQVYRSTALDLGATISCRVRAVNVEGHATTVAVASAPIAQPVVATATTARFIAPEARGAGDGSSWANAAPLSDIQRQAALAGPGGTIFVASDLGAYNPTSTIELMSGGAPGNALRIVGVRSADMREELPVIASNRAPPQDLGATIGLPPGGSRGIEMLRLRAGQTNVTVNTATHIVTATGWAFGSAPAGTPVAFTGSFAVAPAPLALQQIVYLQPVGALDYRVSYDRAGTQLVEFTAAGSGLALGARGDQGAATFDPADSTVTVPAAVYNDLVDGWAVRVSTAGSMPSISNPLIVRTSAPQRTTLFAEGLYYVRKMGGNRLQLHWSRGRMAKNEPILFTDAGVGPHTLSIPYPTFGPNHVEVRNFVVRDGGSQDGAISLRTALRDVAFRSIYAENVYRLFGNTHLSNSTSNLDASAIGLTLEDISVYGCERGLMRLRHASSNILLRDFDVDGRRMAGDPFQALVVFEDSATTRIARTTGITSEDANDYLAESAPCDIVVEWGTGTRAWHNAGPGSYWNGDIFETSNSDSRNVRYSWCEASWATDGGHDDKAGNLVIEHGRMAFSKRTVRLWSTPVTIRDSYLLECQDPGGAYGGSGGRAMIYFGASNSQLLVQRCKIVDSGDANLLDNTNSFNGTGWANNFAATFEDCTLRFNPDGRFQLGGTGNTLTVTPPVAPPTCTITPDPAFSNGVLSTSTPVDTVIATVAGGDHYIVGGSHPECFGVFGNEIRLVASIEQRGPILTLGIKAVRQHLFADSSVNFTYAAGVTGPNTVLYIPFDGVDGQTSATDTIYGRAVTFFGSTAISTAKGYPALRLPGNSNLTMADFNDWTPAGAYTWTLRFSVDTALRYSLLASHWNAQSGGQRSWQLAVGSNGKLLFQWAYGAQTTNQLEGSVTLQDGVEYEARIDLTADGTIRMYVDGVMVAKQTGISPLFYNSNTSLRFGANAQGASYGLGYLRRFRLDKGQALTASDAGYTPVAP